MTLSEAMASGLPCIWTHWAGPRDYGDSQVGFPITKFRMIRLKFDGGFESFGVDPDEKQIIQRMEQIYHGYDRALKLGKKASERMHALYTWKQAAARFIEICEKYI
ncbi:MAG: glycosyltransferase family 4 protein [Planctomycetes bacterium]|nr:glycosyltransferase family 4 protein [Planctomycetota bacterium]